MARSSKAPAVSDRAKLLRKILEKAGQAGGPAVETRAQAQSRRERAQADREEFERDELLGLLVRSEHARMVLLGAGQIYAAGRESLPGALAPRLVGKTDVVEIERIIREVVTAVDTRICNEIESKQAGLIGLAPGNSVAA